MIRHLVAFVALLVLTCSMCLSQTLLDSARTEMLISLFDQVSTPMIQIAKSYQNEKKTFPVDTSALLSYARSHKEPLDIRSYKSFGIAVDTSHQLMLTFSFKPFKMSLGEKEGDSRVTALSGTVRVMPIGKEANGVALIITVNEASIVLPDSSQRRVKEYSQVTAKVVAPRW